MAVILPTNGSCPHCGKKFRDYNAASQDYGSPIRTCGSCQNQYLDGRYHEIALEGYSTKGLNVKNSLKVVALGLGCFVVAGGMSAYTISTKGYYSMKGVAAGFLGFIVMLVGIIDAIRIKTGAKLKSLERKKADSIERLQNPEYAHLLAELGYSVPEQYL